MPSVIDDLRNKIAAQQPASSAPTVSTPNNPFIPSGTATPPSAPPSTPQGSQPLGFREFALSKGFGAPTVNRIWEMMQRNEIITGGYGQLVDLWKKYVSDFFSSVTPTPNAPVVTSPVDNEIFNPTIPARRAGETSGLPNRPTDVPGVAGNPPEPNQSLGEFLRGLGSTASSEPPAQLAVIPGGNNTASGGNNIWLILAALAGLGLLAYTYLHNKHKEKHGA